MHVVVLVGRDPIVARDRVVGEVGRRLRQGRIFCDCGLLDVGLLPPLVSVKNTIGSCLAA
jgi:hypothetical protein